ncbi:hypothetical protein B296_00017117 [Ensete ventricosum]|uniref:Uncharacterized protein n=1 Tax=Ensete ventricosum TaxID=4639 RepID=A0A426ZB06_ENSVE|nr:hypothetical protein B296_00017117 [Ensete ventricosum]
MLHLGVTQEWVDEGELPREQTKNRRWRRPYDVLAEATRGEVVVQVQHTRICLQWRCHQEATWCMIGAAGELDCFSAHIHLREPDKSEDKAETARRTQWCRSRWSKGARKRNESSGAQLPKSKASVRKEVDSEERHRAVEVDLLIANKGMKIQGNG